MNPLLSVVVPVLEAASALDRTRKSLEPLLEAGWAELVVQDGTPGAMGLEAKGVRWFAELDSGLYDGMNRGLKRVHGQWVLFAGAGDEWIGGDEVRRALERAVGPMVVFRTEMARPLEPGVPASYPARWDGSMRWHNTTHHQGVCYRVSALPESPFDVRWRTLADYAFHLQLWASGWEADLQEAAAMRAAPGGVSRRFGWGLYREEWRMKASVLGWGAAVAQGPWLGAKWAFKRLAGLRGA